MDTQQSRLLGLLVVVGVLVYVAHWSFERYQQQLPLANAHLLVLGGNGFLGQTTARRLAELGANLTLVNRGNEYSSPTRNNHSSPTMSPPLLGNQGIRHVWCDRSLLDRSCDQLSQLPRGTFDGVVDFSGLSGALMLPTLKLLRKSRIVKASGLYVYVSSDAVYDAANRTETAPLTEEDVAFGSGSDIDAYEAANEHTRGKYECETQLHAARRNVDSHSWLPPVVYLRLPDVFGQGDTSNRFFSYFVWMKLHQVMSFPLWLFLKPDPNSPSRKVDDDAKISFAYSQDVAEFIARLLQPRDHTSFADEAINFAFMQNPQELRDFLFSLCKSVFKGRGFPEDTFVHEKISRHHAHQLSFYPSKPTRPPLNTSKLQMLADGALGGFRTTEFHRAIEETANYFDEMLREIVKHEVEHGVHDAEGYRLDRFSMFSGIPKERLVNLLARLYEEEDAIGRERNKEL